MHMRRVVSADLHSLKAEVIVAMRLLRLPARFFKDYSAGDLNQRLENVEQMRQLAVSVVMSAGLTAVLSVLAMAPPLLVRAVINRVIADGQRGLLPALGVFMLLVPVASAACNWLQVLGVAFVGQDRVLEVEDQRHQGLGDKPPAVNAEASVFVRACHERVEEIVGHRAAADNQFVAGDPDLLADNSPVLQRCERLRVEGVWFDANEDGLLTEDEIPEKLWPRIVVADTTIDDVAALPAVDAIGARPAAPSRISTVGPVGRGSPPTRTGMSPLPFGTTLG